MKRTFVLALLAVVVTLGTGSAAFSAGQDERQMLIEAAAEETASLSLAYTDSYEVTYDEDEQGVLVRFRTLPNFKVNYNLFYLQWWDAQFIALDCFQRRDIPVKAVRVETNFVDGSGPLAAITSAAFIKKYANAAYGMTRWLDLSTLLLYDEERGWYEPPK